MPPITEVFVIVRGEESSRVVMIEQSVTDGLVMATTMRAQTNEGSGVKEDRGNKSPIQTNKSPIKTIYGVLITRNNATLKRPASNCMGKNRC